MKKWAETDGHAMAGPLGVYARAYLGKDVSGGKVAANKVLKALGVDEKKVGGYAQSHHS